MLVKPKIRELLDKIEQIKPYLASIGYKLNQANTREAMERILCPFSLTGSAIY